MIERHFEVDRLNVERILAKTTQHDSLHTSIEFSREEIQTLRVMCNIAILYPKVYGENLTMRQMIRELLDQEQ
jgi:hypothetical protein